MPSELVFITGATGMIGFRTLLDALNLGYKARVAVRSESKKETILSNPAFKALNAADRVSFVIVPDLTEDGAYDEAVKGVDYILHIASPLVNSDELTHEERIKYYIEPAVKGTVSILDSAAKNAPTVKRIVITSSVVAIKTFKALVGIEGGVAYAESRVPDDEGPYMNEMHAYVASKIASLNAAESWLKGNKHTFDVVYVHPGFVEGRDDLALTPKAAISGTNAVILGVANGKADGPIPGASVHLYDVAKMHVESLNTAKIPAGSYVAQWNPEGNLEGTHWEEINTILEKDFPEQIKSGVLKPGPVLGSIRTETDSTKTEKTFGWKFLDFESQVKSVVGHYVELVASSQ